MCVERVILFIAAALLLSGCKTRYVTTEVPVVMHDTISTSVAIHSTDTIERLERIHVYDTMYIDTSTIATLGMPTLRHEREKMIDNTSTRSHHTDTTNIIERIIEKPVVVHDKEYVETNVLYWWQTALMWAGALAIVALGALLIWKK